MALLTKWDVRDIQAAIATDFGDGRELFMPNISWGFFRSKGMEADLLWLHGTKLEEFEIKRSKEDFLADFKKAVFHSDIRITRLHYVLPEAMAGEWLKTYCAEHYQAFKRVFDFRFYREYDCSIIMPERHNHYAVDPKFTSAYYLDDGMVEYIEAHDPASAYYRHLFAEEMSELFRLVVIRYWHREKAELHESRKRFLEHDPEHPTTYMDWWRKEEVDRLRAEDGQKRQDPAPEPATHSKQ